MKHIEIYTDGSATIATKPGGYGFVIVVDGDKLTEGSGHMEKASNNDAEMEAAIQGLAAALKILIDQARDPQSVEVSLVSDSQLILGWANGSYKFKQLDKMKKYHQLKALMARMKVKTRWVEGHSGDEHNERCDKLANQARKGLEKAVKIVDKDNSSIGDKKTGVICIWYKGSMKVIDLDTNVVEDYKRDIHGPRGSFLEIREDRAR